jgi:hypothetical protein
MAIGIGEDLESENTRIQSSDNAFGPYPGPLRDSPEQ